VSETNKCKHCGAFVPAEKAFCPNCSEPMETEETSHRPHSFSSDMMATIRDDPEKYKNLLVPPVKKQQQPAPPAEAQRPEPASPPSYAQPPVTGFNYPEDGNVSSTPAKSSSSSYLIPGIVIVIILVLLFVILFAYKII
jgi:hypothetical protein